MRSSSTPASAAAHKTLITFMEFRRPQRVIMPVSGLRGKSSRLLSAARRLVKCCRRRGDRKISNRQRSVNFPTAYWHCLIGGGGRGQVLHRIDGGRPLAQLEMDLRARDRAGLAGLGDDI